MCIPLLPPVMDFIGGQQAHHDEVQAANLNYAQKFNADQAEGAQVNAQQSESNLSDSVKAAQSFGTIAASASSLGLGTYSLSNLFGSDATAAQRTQAITDANYAGKRNAIATDLQGAALQRNSEIRAANASKPGLVSLALGVQKAVTDTASQALALGAKF